MNQELELAQVGELQATSIEAYVLGLLMQYPQDGKAVGLPLLTLADFHNGKHRTIFRAIEALDKGGTVPENVAVVEILRQSAQLEAVGGAFAVAKLSMANVSPANLEKYCRTLNEFTAKRRLRKHAYAVLNSLEQGDDIFETLAAGEKEFSDIQTSFVKTESLNLKQAVTGSFNYLLDRHENPQQARIQFGIPTLDRIAGGMEPGDIVVWAARPGVGKTDALIHFARHNGLKNKLPGLIFSMEMTAVQMGFRFLAYPSGVPANVMREHISKTDLTALAGAVDEFENGELVMLDAQPGHTFASMRASILQNRAKLAAQGHVLKWVALDYVQLVQGMGKATAEEAIKTISIGLKALAKELGLVILELAQLGREVDKRDPPVPAKADLRGSAQLEMDADMIVLPYRPSYYQLDVDSEGAPIASHELEEYVEFIVDKNRHKRPGTAIGRYLPAESRFDVFPTAGETGNNSFPTSTFDEPTF